MTSSDTTTQPPLVSVVDTLQSGRYIEAATDIPAGTLIHASLPYVLVPHPTSQRQQCVACFRHVDSPAGSSGHSTAAKKKTSGGGGKGRPLKNGAYLQMKAQLAQSKAASSARLQQTPATPDEIDDNQTHHDDDDPLSTADVSSLQAAPCGQCPAVYCSAACKKLYHATHTTSQECLAMKIASETSAHRNPREVHFLAIVLNITLRAAKEGCAARLLQKPSDATEVLEAAGDLLLNAATVAAPTLSNDVEESMNETDPGLADKRRIAEATATTAPLGPQDSVETTISVPQVTAHTQGKQPPAIARSAEVGSHIPTEALRIRAQHEARGFVEVVDPKSARSALEDVMRACSTVPSTNTTTTQHQSNTHKLSLLYQSIKPSTWDDYGLLVTNLSVISKDRLSEYRALYRYFLKAMALCPGELFGLEPPPPPTPATAARTLRRTAPPPPPNFVGGRTVVSSEMFYSICGALQMNGFGVYNDGDTCIAIGSYPFASYFNHSCAPNICRIMEGRVATFYTLCDVAKGTPLCICYCDVEDPTSLRRAQLLSSYRFHCECLRCSGSEPLRFDRCRKCTARGYLVLPIAGASTPASSDRLIEGQCSVCRQLSPIYIPGSAKDN
jgi:ribosomal protein L40E